MWDIVKSELHYKKRRLILCLGIPMVFLILTSLGHADIHSFYTTSLMVGVLATTVMIFDKNRNKRLRIYGTLPVSLKQISLARIVEVVLVIAPILVLWIFYYTFSMFGKHRFPFWVILKLNGFLLTYAFLLLIITCTKWSTLRRIIIVTLLILFVLPIAGRIYSAYYIPPLPFTGITPGFHFFFPKFYPTILWPLAPVPLTVIGFNALAALLGYLAYSKFMKRAQLINDGRLMWKQTTA